VINSINAPPHKVSKYLVHKLNGYLNIDHQLNVKNSISLAEDITKLNINENHRMITYDTKDLYINMQIKK